MAILPVEKCGQYFRIYSKDAPDFFVVERERCKFEEKSMKNAIEDHQVQQKGKSATEIKESQIDILFKIVGLWKVSFLLEDPSPLRMQCRN